MAFAAWLAATALIPAALIETTASDGATAIAFVDVTVLPMDRPGALPHHTVIVRGDRIDAVGESAKLAIPPGAQRIDGAGRFLLPGLIDDHVHLFDERDLLLYLANGVTTVRNLKGSPFHLELRESIRAGTILGPRFLTSGPFLNEPYVTTPDEVEAAVLAQADAGYDCLKIHGRLSLDAFTRLCDLGEQVGLPIVGHVPRNLLLEDVLALGGMVEISHAEEILYTHFDPLGRSLDEREIGNAVAIVKAAGVRVTPTLVAYGGIADQVEDLERVLARPEVSFLPPLARKVFGRELNEYVQRFDQNSIPNLRRSRAFQAKLVKALHDAGVPILLGTDAMIPVVVPGFSVVDELVNLVDAGFSPWEALASATVRAGDFLAVEPPLGRIAPGAAADLLLVDADPLARVDHVGKRAGVMTRGRWIPREEIDRLLRERTETFAHEAAIAALVRRDSVKEALEAARKLPKQPDGASSLDERFLESLGQLYLSARAPALAVEVLEASVELHPGSERARRRVAEARALVPR